MPSETFNRVMKVNFEAVVQLTRLFLPSLRTRPDARIINISSLYGLVGGREQTAYSASKFAVTGFSSALRFDLADTSVRVQVVFPGGVKTAIVQNAISPEGLTAEQVEKRKASEQRLLRMSPDKAATIILSGIQRNKFRILVGGDVVFMDWLARLFPQGHAKLLKSLIKLRKLF
jgi:short-subunit dehydrogenase